MTEPQQPLNPDPPAPPGQEDLEAPDLSVEIPEEREKPDQMAVTDSTGTVEAPD